jgi:hypothetical protein
MDATDRYGWFLDAKDVSAPILMIGSADQTATRNTLTSMLESSDPIIRWDCLNGAEGVNSLGVNAVAAMFKHQKDSVLLVKLLLALPKAHARTVVFIHNAHRFLKDSQVLQGIFNLRDTFKQDGRMLVLLSHDVEVPPELVGSILDYQEPLPTDDEIGELADAVVKSACESNECEIKIGEKDRARVIQAARGLPAFQAETVMAMSISDDGYDQESLWDRKIQELERIPGVRLVRGEYTLDDVGGQAGMKVLSGDLQGAVVPVDLIVFFDEIEKSMAGANAQSGDSGVSQDMHGQLLTWTSTNNVEGVLLYGLQGGGKTFFAECLGATHKIPTLIVDIGACKSKYVGSSGQNFRRVLEVINGMAKNPLLVATCNDDTALSREFMDRFSLGTYFFDEPTDDEKVSIWEAHLRRYPIVDPDGNKIHGVDPTQPKPDDEHWTGRDIAKCVRFAYTFKQTLIEASGRVVPLSKSDPDNLETMRRKADNRFLSASYTGTYRHPEERQEPVQAPSEGASRRIVKRSKIK